jgi:ribosomal protein S18 acetylase RimI-like enzyme
MNISQAGIADIDDVALLFDQYRQFYNEAPDHSGCQHYIRTRLENSDSIIFLVRANDDELLGFTQLYPSYCSVAMRPILYLYDLFVIPAARRTGIGRALIEHARDAAKDCGAARLTLETQTTNSAGQSLYEALGFERDVDFYTYHLEI